jgi:hypothetical protein
MNGDQTTQAEVTLAAWTRVESWLRQHAPRTFDRLPEPATQDEILALEQQLDLKVPADVRAFYLLRNGTGPASDFEWPASHDEPEPTGYFLPDGEGIGPLDMLSVWFNGPAGAEDLDAQPHRRHLPLTATDPDGFYGVFTDCTPGEGYGLLGSYAEAELPSPGEESFSTYLTQVADALWAGRGLLNGTAPRVVDGRLDWD